MAHNSSRPPSLSQCISAEYSEVEQAQMVGSAPHMDIMAVAGRAGRVSKGKSDCGSGSQWEHGAENKYIELR